jgi:hypothetical protein
MVVFFLPQIPQINADQIICVDLRNVQEIIYALLAYHLQNKQIKSIPPNNQFWTIKRNP